MLSVDEFTSGSLSDAQPPALMLPRTHYEQPFIVGRANQSRVAVFIGGLHSFEYFEYDKEDNWLGLIINGITLEADESALVDPNSGQLQSGCLVRVGTNFSIRAIEKKPFQRPRLIPLIENLVEIPEEHGVGFLRWQIVIGHGISKRVLRTIDVSPKKSP